MTSIVKKLMIRTNREVNFKLYGFHGLLYMFTEQIANMLQNITKITVV